MKNFIILIISIILMLVCIIHFDLTASTRTGERLESFKSLDGSYLPSTLRTYLANNYVKFELWAIPNYVKEFLSTNKDYSSIYESKPKYTILIYSSKIDSSPNIYYKTITEAIEPYAKYYNLIFQYKTSDKKVYSSPYDNRAVKELMEYCKSFCLIDPNLDTLFAFKNLKNTETDAIIVLIQQYALFQK